MAVVVLHAGVGRCLRPCRTADFRDAGLDDLVQLRNDDRRDGRQHLLNQPADVLRHRQAVDLGQPVVDLDEPEVQIEHAQSDRRSGIEVRHSLPRVCFGRAGDIIGRHDLLGLDPDCRIGKRRSARSMLKGAPATRCPTRDRGRTVDEHDRGAPWPAIR